jgi:uracil phosphoribosyltransferase
VPELHVVQHPYIADKVRQLRDKRTTNEQFRRLAREITRYLAYEALRTCPTTATTVDTPVVDRAPAECWDEEFVVVPILRAGLGMTGALEEILPHLRLCPVGLRRNETTLMPDIYMNGLPRDLGEAPVLVCDPMLATGGSLNVTLDLVQQSRGGAVTVLCLIAARPGIDAVINRHPSVRIVTAAIDEKLTPHGYITPGLGDAGDRLFGQPSA